MVNIKIVFVLAFIICISIGYSQKVDSAYEVGTWQGFCSCAASFTFDDGTTKQFSVAIPMFDEFGFKLTLFTVINGSAVGFPTNWTALQAAANNGHEIASHTLTHPHLGQLTDEQQTTEIKNSQDTISAYITGQKCITLAYPYCETGTISITKQYYIAARMCSGYIESRTPSDFYRISSIVCGTQGSSMLTSQHLINKLSTTASSKGWLVLLFHGIDDDGGWSPVANSDLRGTLNYLDTTRTKYWVSTFGNVVRYIKERNNVSVTQSSIDDSSITFQVTDTLDNSIYDYPITIRRQLPDGWPSAIVSQNSLTISSQIVDSISKKYVMFDVVPDEGDILISKSTSTSVNANNKSILLRPILMQNYPNPFNPKTKINYTIKKESYVTIKVYDLYGREIVVLVNEEKSPGNYEVEFNGSNLSSGVYFYKIRAGNFINTKKLILMK
jgi:oligosaccharide reducing-end xylanase